MVPTDRRLTDLRTAARLRASSWLLTALAIVVFGPMILLGWQYPEPQQSVIRYAGLAVALGLSIYRWSITRRPLGPAASEAAER